MEETKMSLRSNIFPHFYFNNYIPFWMFDIVRQTTTLWDGGSRGQFQDFIEKDSHNYVTRYSVHDGTAAYCAELYSVVQQLSLFLFMRCTKHANFLI
jgi:hypothetical protein